MPWKRNRAEERTHHYSYLHLHPELARLLASCCCCKVTSFLSFTGHSAVLHSPFAASRFGDGGMEEERLYTGHGQQQQKEKEMEWFSDDKVESRGGEEEEEKGASGSGTQAAPSPSGRGDSSATNTRVETGKRRRGRPPGSKNKPKPPGLVVTQEAEPAAAMRPHVLEIPGGGDVAGALAGFVRRRGLGICVLAGTGAVVDVSLRLPSPSAAAEGAAPIVFHGRYEILSISATFLPLCMSAGVPLALGGLSISLAGPHGQIVGGAVAGPLVAATTVVVMAAAFTSATFHRLPADAVDASASVSGSGEAHEHRVHQPEEPPRAQQDHVGRLQPPHNMASHEARAAPAASTPRPLPPYQ